jgi:hypothetical protein
MYKWIGFNRTCNAVDAVSMMISVTGGACLHLSLRERDFVSEHFRHHFFLFITKSNAINEHLGINICGLS